MKGRIATWKEDKGFGFIRPDGQKDTIFVHISQIKKTIRPPQVGDSVVFELTQDAQGRPRAEQVVLEGVALDARAPSNRITTEPVKKDALDYLAYLALCAFVLVAAALYLRGYAAPYFALPAVGFVAIYGWLAVRQKRPQNPLFSCSKCKTVATHDARSIQAWNRGFAKLYCRACHQAWQRQQAQEPQSVARGSGTSASSKAGCLGTVLVLVLTPMLVTAGVVTWLM